MNLATIHLPTLESMRDRTQARIDELNAELEAASGGRVWQIKTKIIGQVREIKAVKREIELRRLAGEVGRCDVADHALIRYLDRELGYDIEDLKQRILTPEVRAMIESGAEKITLESGNTLIIQHRVVVTITPPVMP